MTTHISVDNSNWICLGFWKPPSAWKVFHIWWITNLFGQVLQCAGVWPEPGAVDPRGQGGVCQRQQGEGRCCRPRIHSDTGWVESTYVVEEIQTDFANILLPARTTWLYSGRLLADGPAGELWDDCDAVQLRGDAQGEVGQVLAGGGWRHPAPWREQGRGRPWGEKGLISVILTSLPGKYWF